MFDNDCVTGMNLKKLLSCNTFGGRGMGALIFFCNVAKIAHRTSKQNTQIFPKWKICKNFGYSFTYSTNIESFLHVGGIRHDSNVRNI